MIIAVIGESTCDDNLYKTAHDVGTLVAEAGWITMTGGLGGVMEAALKGAKDSGGLTIGVLPGSSKADANQYVDIPIVTGMRHARNVVIAYTADALIAVAGKYGTLSEIAISLKLGKPVFGIQTWENIPGMRYIESPRDAVHKLRALLADHIQ